MKQKTHDIGGPSNTPDTSSDGVLKDLAAKAKALAPALATEQSGDPRRGGDIKVTGNATRYILSIDGEMWAEIDWSEGRRAWCIQNCCGFCLEHIENMLATIPNDGSIPPDGITHVDQLKPTSAIEKAKRMIRDGTMTSPEDAKAAFKKMHGKTYPHPTRGF